MDGVKSCTRCKEVKPLSSFGRRGRSSDGRQYACRSCRKLYQQKNSEAIRIQKQIYYNANRERVLSKNKEQYEANWEERKAQQRDYYHRNRENILASQKLYEKRTGAHKRYKAEHHVALAIKRKEYRREHPEEVREKASRAYHENPEKYRQRSRAWYKKNRDSSKIYAEQYRKENGELIKIRMKKYRKTHPERSRHDSRLRKARKLRVVENFTQNQDTFVRGVWDNKCAICEKMQGEEKTTLAIDHWYPLSKGHALTMRNAVLMCRSCNSRKKDHYPSDVFDWVTVVRVEEKIKKQEIAWEAKVKSTVA